MDTALTGHFLTRDEAARRSRLATTALATRPDTLPLGGRCAAEEVYPAFAFDDEGLRPDVAAVVERLRSEMDPWSAATWLVTPNAGLGGTTPLQRITDSGPTPVLGVL